MSLSNWAILAFDNEGSPSSGEVEFPSGIRVEIYKNWVYLHDSKAWRENQSFMKDTIAQIQHGYITIGRTQIICDRHGEDGGGIFVLAVNSEWTKDDRAKYCFFAGIGVYGYDDNLPRLAKAVGVNMADYPNCEFSYGTNQKKELALICVTEDYEFFREWNIPYSEEFEPKYVGITKETYEDFLVWLRKTLISQGLIHSPLNIEEKCPADKWYDKITSQKAVQANQGDLYFQTALVDYEAPTYSPGENPTEPHIMNLLK